MESHAKASSSGFGLGVMTGMILTGTLILSEIKEDFKEEIKLNSKIREVVCDSIIADTTKYQNLTNYFLNDYVENYIISRKLK